MKPLKNKFKNVYILGRYPDADWRRLFSFFIIVGFIIGCWSVYLFIQINSEAFILESNSGSARALAETKDKELKAVVDRYEAKRSKYLELQSGTAFRSIPVGTASTTATSTTDSATTTGR